MISEAEHRRLSRGSADGSSGSPRDLQPLDSDDFVNKVAKFEMISRGKSATSPTAKSPPPPTTKSPPPPTTPSSSGPTTPGGKYSGMTSPGFVGEKVFSRDTATTRVSAAVLQGNGERVISTCSSLSSSSLTSVSTLNCSSDSSGSNRSLATPPVTPQGSLASPSGLSQGSWHGQFPGSSHAMAYLQGPTFITLGDRRLDGRGEATPVVIRPAAEGYGGSKGRTVVNGDPANIHTHQPKQSSGGVALRDSGSSREDAGSDRSHRDTFEGMDFDVSQMTESEQELARRHREIVAERKREQKQEKMERQRLEEILRMCAEYQQEVDSPTSPGPRPPSSSSSSRAHPLAGSHSSISSSSSSASASSASSLKLRRVAPAQAFMDAPKPAPEADQDRNKADFNSTVTKPLPEPEERKFSGEFRTNVTKIKTNGSLMLSSPSNAHKDGGSSYQIRRCESNSSTSEDEMLAGNSEDTGTIKRRPQPPTVPEEMLPPGHPMSPAHVSLDRNHVPAAVPSVSSVPYSSSVFSGSKYTSVSSPQSAVPAKSAVYASGHNHTDSPSKDSAFSSSSKESSSLSPPPSSSSSSSGQSRIDEILNSSFEAEREAAGMSGYGKFSVHINAQISCDGGDNNDNVDDDDDDDDLRDVMVVTQRSKRSVSSTSSSKGSSRSSESSSNHTVLEAGSGGRGVWEGARTGAPPR
ncbi:hypothetical protein ACOMHN_000642 [Nucella lapillus]